MTPIFQTPAQRKKQVSPNMSVENVHKTTATEFSSQIANTEQHVQLPDYNP